VIKRAGNEQSSLVGCTVSFDRFDFIPLPSPVPASCHRCSLGLVPSRVISLSGNSLSRSLVRIYDEDFRIQKPARLNTFGAVAEGREGVWEGGGGGGPAYYHLAQRGRANTLKRKVAD
jgi:hypothetical protein